MSFGRNLLRTLACLLALTGTAEYTFLEATPFFSFEGGNSGEVLSGSSRASPLPAAAVPGLGFFGLGGRMKSLFDEHHLWRFTKLARSRDPLYSPMSIRRMKGSGFSFSFSVTPKAKSTHEPSVVLETETVNRLFKDVSTLIGQEPNSDSAGAVGLIPFLSKAESSEGRLFGMFSFAKELGNFVLQADLSLGISIGYPTLKEEYSFLREDFDVVFQKIREDDGEGSTRSEGPGDLRISLGYKLEETGISVFPYVHLIAPTSRLGKQATPEELPPPRTDSMLSLLSDLSGYATKLMFGPRRGVGHWGLGIGSDLRLKFPNSPISVNGSVIYTHYFAAERIRFIPPRVPVSLLSVYTKIGSGGLDVEEVMPKKVSLRVSPGDIFFGQISMDIDITRWLSLSCGASLYSQGPERAEYSQPREFSKYLVRRDDVTPFYPEDATREVSFFGEARILLGKFLGGDLQLRFFGEKRISGVGGDTFGIGLSLGF